MPNVLAMKLYLQMEDLASHVKSLADQFHGLSLEKCCQLAYEFASANDLTMPAIWTRHKKAGMD